MTHEIMEDLKRTLGSIVIPIKPLEKKVKKEVKAEIIPIHKKLSPEEHLDNLQKLVKGNKEEKLKALETLRHNYKPDDAVYMLNAIDDENAEVRELAAGIAGELKINEALGDLIVHLEDESENVVEASLDSIVTIENPFIPEAVKCIFKSGEFVDVLCKVLTTSQEEAFNISVTLFPRNREIIIPSELQLALRGFLMLGAVLFPRKETIRQHRNILFEEILPGEFKLMPGKSVNAFQGDSSIIRDITFYRDRIAAAAGDARSEIWTLETDNINMSCTLQMELTGDLTIRFSLVNYPLTETTLEFQVVSRDDNRLIMVEKAGLKVPFTGEIELEPIGKELFGEKFMGRLDFIEVRDIVVITYLK